MDLPVPPWINILLRYCPRCRLEYPAGTTRCAQCREPLVDKVRRVKVEER